MRILLMVILTAFLTTACGTAKTAPSKSAEAYFKEGEAHFERGLYDDAIAAWEKARELYYSPELNALVDLKIAESHFLSKRYLEAAIAYEDFLKQYPHHERTQHALYQLAMSHYKQVLDLDRDQTATRNTLVTLENFLTRSPEGPEAEDARRIIRECHDRLAAHELYVGRYYLRAGQPKAAIRRLEGLFSRYPEFSERDQAFFYLGQSYLRAGNREAAFKSFAALDREFPHSQFVVKARKSMEKVD